MCNSTIATCTCPYEITQMVACFVCVSFCMQLLSKVNTTEWGEILMTQFCKQLQLTKFGYWLYIALCVNLAVRTSRSSVFHSLYLIVALNYSVYLLCFSYLVCNVVDHRLVWLQALAAPVIFLVVLLSVVGNKAEKLLRHSIFGSSRTDASQVRLKRTRVRTHDLQIMTIHFMSLRRLL